MSIQIDNTDQIAWAFIAGNPAWVEAEQLDAATMTWRFTNRDGTAIEGKLSHPTVQEDLFFYTKDFEDVSE